MSEVLDLHLLRKMMRTQFIVSTISCCAAGANAALAVYTLRRLKSLNHLPPRTFRRICAFVATSWVCYFIGNSASIVLQTMAYFVPKLAKPQSMLPIQALSLVPTGLLVCFSDGLLVFRTWIIWDRPRVFVVPAVLIVAQALDIIIAVTLYATKIASLATMQWLMLACLCISLVVNFVLVCASIVRLLQARARVRNAELGSGAHYVALIRILVFSGALYMLGTILTIILRTTMYATLCYVLNSTILTSTPLLIFLHIPRERPATDPSLKVPCLLDRPSPVARRAEHPAAGSCICDTV